VHEYYLGWLCQRAESQSGREATNKFKSLSSQLLMAADMEWTIHEYEGQRSVNYCWLCKYGN